MDSTTTAQSTEAVQPTKYVVARAADIPEGTRLLIDVQGRSVGVFNVEGSFYALLNRCPHLGGELCKGDVINLVQSDRPGDMRLDKSRHLITCPMHGWEYDIATGQSWFDPRKVRTRPFGVTVRRGDDLSADLAGGETATPVNSNARLVDAKTHRVKGPYTAEVIPVSVEDDYVVISLRPPANG
jgi:nitrite reductase/ring-hydroxylating ferredoxin subunit